MPANAGRALIVDEGTSWSTLCAVRALARSGWSVTVGCPGARGIAAASRHVDAVHDVPSLAEGIEPFESALRDALARSRAEVVFDDVLAVSRADLYIAVGRELEIGWLPPLMTSSRNAKIQPASRGYLDASQNVRILDIPTGQITRAMGDVHPLGNPHYWLEPGNGDRKSTRLNSSHRT